MWLITLPGSACVSGRLPSLAAQPRAKADKAGTQSRTTVDLHIEDESPTQWTQARRLPFGIGRTTPFLPAAQTDGSRAALLRAGSRNDDRKPYLSRSDR